MKFKKGDYVTRTSYNHDTLFKIININGNMCYLKGVNVRLYADSINTDLKKADIKEEKDDNYRLKLESFLNHDRSDYFFLPAKILHLDGDNEYLKRCLNFYKDAGVLAVGKTINESDMPNNITALLLENNPDIVIITGHDAYYKKKGSINDINNYKNSINFAKAIKNARKYEKSHDKLVIIAGACQSDYEELIKAGANFASSPKRVNIHALDPALIAITLALTERDKSINLIELLEKTKYGKDGMGGLQSNGLMFVGYPR